MRPVTRGEKPEHADTYEEMREVLLKDWGEYCSYCELPIINRPDAEHILPKTKNPDERDNWDNLLLSCGVCNPRKGSKRPTPQTLDSFLWPSRDNTARAFKYDNIFPEVADGLTKEQQRMAARLRGLLVLGDTNDKRHKKRAEAFKLAKEFANDLRSSPDTVLARKAIRRLAEHSGFFSVWMEVFSDDIEMRKEIIAAFPGTAKDCFDAETKPVARPNGRV
jgi:HNH endonuclease